MTNLAVKLLLGDSSLSCTFNYERLVSNLCFQSILVISQLEGKPNNFKADYRKIYSEIDGNELEYLKLISTFEGFIILGCEQSRLIPDQLHEIYKEQWNAVEELYRRDEKILVSTLEVLCVICFTIGWLIGNKCRVSLENIASLLNNFPNSDGNFFNFLFSLKITLDTKCNDLGFGEKLKNITSIYDSLLVDGRTIEESLLYTQKIVNEEYENESICFLYLTAIWFLHQIEDLSFVNSNNNYPVSLHNPLAGH